MRSARAIFAQHATSLIASAAAGTEQRTTWARALRALRRRGIDDLAALEAALPQLTDASADVALRLVARYGRRIGAPVLVTALQRADGLEVTAALQLSMLGGAVAQRRCIALLRSDVSPATRHAAAYALAHLRDRDALGVEALIACLSDQRELPAIRGLRAEGLDASGPHRRRAVAAALRGLDDRSPEVRFWCAFALSAMRARRALPVLRRVAATDHAMCPGWWRVSSEARDAIASIEGRRVRLRRHSNRSSAMQGA